MAHALDARRAPPALHAHLAQLQVRALRALLLLDPRDPALRLVRGLGLELQALGAGEHDLELGARGRNAVERNEVARRRGLVVGLPAPEALLVEDAPAGVPAEAVLFLEPAAQRLRRRSRRGAVALV